MGNGFKMDDPFLKGVPYLSWEEEAEARAVAAAEWTNDIPDIALSPGDTENMQLLEGVRLEINAWNKRGEVSALRTNAFLSCCGRLLKCGLILDLTSSVELTSFCRKSHLT